MIVIELSSVAWSALSVILLMDWARTVRQSYLLLTFQQQNGKRAGGLKA